MERDEWMDGASIEVSKEGAQAPQYSVSDLATEQRMAWWREARLGLFVHWGPYSVLGGRWKGEEVEATYAEHVQLRGKIPIAEYEQVAGAMDIDAFNALDWVHLAKRAGAKYLIVTTKHHDGFAMYDSEVSNYSITKHTGVPRDPIAELAQACEEEGIRLCLYYSHAMDWHHPDSQGNTLDFPHNAGAWDLLEDWIEDDEKRIRFEHYLEEKALPQVEELLTRYGRINVIWFDCGHKITDEHAVWFQDLVHRLQPDCLINKRLRNEQFADYGNPGDNQLRVRPQVGDWESIHTLNDSWGFRYADQNWKSPNELIDQLIRTISGNGNFVLNVGPLGNGEIDPISRQLLEVVGDWIVRNKEAIYGTAGSPIGVPQWGCCTWKKESRTLNLFVQEWPSNGLLIVPGVSNELKEARLLSDPARRLSLTRIGANDWMIDAGSIQPELYATVIQLKYEGELDADPTSRYMTHIANRYWAYEGTIEGEGLRYDNGKRGHDGVTEWTGLDASVSWTIRTAEEVRCRVIVSYSADPDQAGSSFSVLLGSESVNGVVEDTGGAGCYGEREIGIVTLLSTGLQRLEVRALSLTGKSLMNLRNVTLLPLEEGRSSSDEI
ncbi:MAG: alpha-L-fucosidase [Candidatus Pristimantibacillus sp.]